MKPRRKYDISVTFSSAGCKCTPQCQEFMSIRTICSQLCMCHNGTSFCMVSTYFQCESLQSFCNIGFNEKSSNMIQNLGMGRRMLIRRWFRTNAVVTKRKPDITGHKRLLLIYQKTELLCHKSQIQTFGISHISEKPNI